MQASSAACFDTYVVNCSDQSYWCVKAIKSGIAADFLAKIFLLFPNIVKAVLVF